ncbi:MAG TPA: hypothetical protein VNS58_00580 [Puia sp.]|nr:hypothetical protein [Puia sp.]
MEFRTKLVVRRKNKKAYVAYAGLGIAMCSLVLVFFPSMEDYLGYVFGTGIAIVIIGAIIAKGDVTNYGLSEEELVVSPDRILIGGQSYPMNRVSKMDFDVQAYAGRYMNDGAMISGTSSDGMTNSLHFEFNGKAVKCGFFLRNKEHVLELGGIFDGFYQRRIPFIERNKSTRTYLFQILTDPQVEEFKRRYGYA